MFFSYKGGLLFEGGNTVFNSHVLQMLHPYLKKKYFRAYNAPPSGALVNIYKDWLLIAVALNRQALTLCAVLLVTVITLFPPACDIFVCMGSKHQKLNHSMGQYHGLKFVIKTYYLNYGTLKFVEINKYP
jgi:hypothetical protein